MKTLSNVFQADNGTVFEMTIIENGEIVNISNASVEIVMRIKQYTVTKQATITAAQYGKCEITLSSSDITVEGVYQFQAQVKYTDGRVFSSDIQRFEVKKRLDSTGQNMPSPPITGGDVSIGDSTINGNITVNGMEIRVYDDAGIKQDILTLQGNSHSHTNLDSLSRLGVNTNNKLTIDGIELVTGGTGGGSSVKDSTINGNILVDGNEINIYDDTSIVQSLNSKANASHTHAEYALAETVSQLQLQLQDALDRIGKLESKQPVTELWSFDFTLDQSTGTYNLANDPNWTHTLTVEDIYGANLDGQNAKAKLYTLGVVDDAPDDPLEMPRKDFDTFEAPSMHTSYQYDADLQQFYFTSMAMNPYYFRIVKYS